MTLLLRSRGGEDKGMTSYNPHFFLVLIDISHVKLLIISSQEMLTASHGKSSKQRKQRFLIYFFFASLRDEWQINIFFSLKYFWEEVY